MLALHIPFIDSKSITDVVILIFPKKLSCYLFYPLYLTINQPAITQRVGQLKQIICIIYSKVFSHISYVYNNFPLIYNYYHRITRFYYYAWRHDLSVFRFRISNVCLKWKPWKNTSTCLQHLPWQFDFSPVFFFFLSST